MWRFGRGICGAGHRDGECRTDCQPRLIDAAPEAGTNRWYGISGNSLVAVVELGGRGVVARAVTAGGENGDPAPAYFADQAERYALGAAMCPLFYPDDLANYIVRACHPGG